jgi:excisionase family DNA binding protein
VELAPPFTVAEAAELLGVSVKTVHRLIDRGELPAFRIASSRVIRIHLSDLQALLRPILAGNRKAR